MSVIHVDAAIVGAGIAGAWALNLLRRRGYNAVLLEADAIGSDQTLASQGMIHGGLKYALGGQLTGASEAIAAMPRRWRRCLGGDDDVDLRQARVVSDHYYMFSDDSARGRLTGFFASRALRGRIEKLPREQWPGAFSGFAGVVYTLNDFVLDSRSLLQALLEPHSERVLQLRLDADNTAAEGGGYRIELQDRTLLARHLIGCAGNGSPALLQALNITDIAVQQRPLKQVLVRPRHGVELFAHCLTGVTSAEPRLTITSHYDDQQLVWYLGGRLATRGVELSDAQQIEAARQELQTCVPWLDWSGAQYDVLTVNRAEPQQRSGLKPDNAYVARSGSYVQCFPTKLTLAPDMGDRLLAALPEPGAGDAFDTTHPRAALAAYPWISSP